MLRVLHVIETLAPPEGGPPRVVASLTAAQRALGIDAQILSGDGPRLEAYLRHWQVNAKGFSGEGAHTVSGGGLPARAMAMRSWLREHLPRFDLVHVHQLWRLTPTLASEASRRMHVPYLIAPHTSLSSWALSQKRMKKTLARLLVWNRILAGAAGFHALNDLEAEEMRRNVGSTAPPAFVVPNGVSLTEFSAAPVASGPAAVGHRPFVLFLARLHTMKGPDLLLEAFAAAATDRPELQLVFGGPDFGMQDSLRRRVQELGLLDRVHFLDLVSGSDRLWLLQNALCLCQPSRDEGFSLSILEAMASRRPVVISDRCKFPDVGRYHAGMIVPLSVPDIAAALATYAGEPARRQADGEAARGLIERCYTWDIVSQRTRDMYERVIRSSRNG